MIELTLRPKEQHRLLEGHLWVFGNELSSKPEAPAGTLARVLTHSGTSLGTGFYNPTSKIAVRLLGTECEEITTEFFVERFTNSLQLRNRVLPDEQAYRWVFGEADLLSGLIVDRYANTAVIQMLAAGMDNHKQQICDALRAVAPSLTGIIEKNMAQTRLKEGLELREGIVWGNVPEKVQFLENGIRIETDIVGGQKTGYFLDQKINRRAVAAISKDKRVLDCFCNIGGFALNAAAAGAGYVLGVDSSALAIEAARVNALNNNLNNCFFEQANVFDLLRNHLDNGVQWDVIVLDPPSFAKARNAIGGAIAGYAELNRTALKLLAPGGILVSSSCTQLVTEPMLMDIVYREAARLRKRVRLISRGNQAPDHPVLLAMPETQYLKFLVFDVVASMIDS